MGKIKRKTSSEANPLNNKTRAMVKKFFYIFNINPTRSQKNIVANSIWNMEVCNTQDAANSLL